MLITFLRGSLFLIIQILLLPMDAFASQTAQNIFSKYSSHVVYIENKLGGMGTGFLVRPDLVITNRHVVFGYDALINKWNAPKSLTFKNGKIIKNYISAICSKRVDICFISFAGKVPFSNQPLFTTRPIKAGEELIVIGHPSGIEVPIISTGIASSELTKLPGTDVFNEDSSYLGFTTNAAISLGSSGSPVFSQTGDILGIAVSILKNSQNINFIISSIEIMGMLDRLANGKNEDGFALRPSFELELDKQTKKSLTGVTNADRFSQNALQPKKKTSVLIRSILIDNIWKFQKCYEDTVLIKDSSAAGMLVLDFEVNPDGKVIQAKAISNESIINLAGTCVIAALTQIQFPKSSTLEQNIVRQPLNFSPKARQ